MLASADELSEYAVLVYLAAVAQCRIAAESAELSHVMLTHAHPSAVFVQAYFVQHIQWRGFLHLLVKAVFTARNACPYICMARLDFAEAHRAGRIDRST
jgi:hypothetical protein